MKDLLAMRYPRPLRLRERAFTLRPLERGDEEALLRFFARIPLDERRMLRDDVSDPRIVRRWCRQIRFETVLPIVALEGARVAGDVTLHRVRGGWVSHVAQLRITVDPEFRGLGLGRALAGEMLDLAPRLGVAIVDGWFMPEQAAAMRLFESLEFVPIATLPQHVLDLTCQPHDLVIMSRTLIPVERLSPDAGRDIEEVDVGGSG